MGERGEPKPKTEVPELNYEAGKAEVIKRVLELLKNKKFVIVAFSSSGSPDVGKSFFAGDLNGALNDCGVGAIDVETEDTMANRESPLKYLVAQTLRKHNKGCVIMFSCLELPHVKGVDVRSMMDKDIKKAFDKMNIPFEKVDIWVNLYRPGDNVERNEADLSICNELAVDK